MGVSGSVKVRRDRGCVERVCLYVPAPAAL